MFSNFSNSELVLISNSINEAITAFDDESQFSARIGVETEFAKEFWLRMDVEIQKRQKEDPEGWFGPSPPPIAVE